jgi:8-oxo-dGTP pyrophosphatase MutT (NUDIX family)
VNVEAIRRAVEGVRPVDERERLSKEAVLGQLKKADPANEETSSHHLTASAFVVSTRGVILHRHRRLGIWVQPGGHIDSGEDPATAAARETLEETGLRARHLEPPRLVHVDLHPGPRGHTHYDLRYLLVSDPLDPTPPPDESQEIGWFDETAALERATDDLTGALTKVFRLLDDEPEILR